MLELKQRCLTRDYPESILNYAKDRVRNIPRQTALKKTEVQTKTRRPVFAIRYDPQHPAIPNIQSNNWRSMKSQDTYLAIVFPQPLMTGF